MDIKFNNQLYITFVETLTLSTIIMILTIIEMLKLNEILAYTINPVHKQVRVQSGFENDNFYNDTDNEYDRDTREITMRGLIARVKGHRDTLLNNKLDELLIDFGTRKCKSAELGGTGMEIE